MRLKSIIFVLLSGVGSVLSTNTLAQVDTTQLTQQKRAALTENPTNTANNSLTSNGVDSTLTKSTESTSQSTNSYTNSAPTDFNNTTNYPAHVKNTKGYKNFVFGVYGGLNSTKFKGESTNTSGDLSGRLGYQAGFFVRGGGRLFGQLGAEYFASSSNYFIKGDGQTVANIQDQINIQYIQIPVYIGYKLLQSDRGISAIRLQVGLEYANRISSSSGKFNLTNAEIKSGTFNGLGQLGFDIGPLLIDLTYHYGFSDSITNPTNGNVSSTGFAGSQRRILSASVGFKF